ncbi:MAG: hypothetical protein J7501_17720 [Bdellovibrio sp.]|nr:hypothetical protein [Bdellovibrio sp.]
MIILATSLPAFAAKLTAVKSGKALVDLEGDSFQVGEQFYAVDSSGKKRALMEIKQVKGSKAIAVTVKGVAQSGYTLEPMKRSSGSSTSGRAVAGANKNSWGLTAGFVNSSMTAKNSNGSVSMTGTSFDVLGYYQTYLDKNISVRAFGGYQTLNVAGSGNITCTDGTTNCKADLSYLGLGALVRYSFYRTSSMEWWAGAGLGFLFAMNKSSNILDTSKITTNQTVIGSLGLDYHLSRNNYIPFQFDYTFFPDNNTSSASQMVIRAGYGWNF